MSALARSSSRLTPPSVFCGSPLSDGELWITKTCLRAAAAAAAAAGWAERWRQEAKTVPSSIQTPRARSFARAPGLTCCLCSAWPACKQSCQKLETRRSVSASFYSFEVGIGVSVELTHSGALLLEVIARYTHVSVSGVLPPPCTPTPAV